MSMSAFHYLLIILFVGLDNSANDFDNNLQNTIEYETNY